MDILVGASVKPFGLLAAAPVLHHHGTTTHQCRHQNLARHLRAQGRCVLVDYSARRFKNAIARAEEEGASRFLILGGNEVTAGICKVRTLGGEKKEEDVPLSDFGA